MSHARNILFAAALLPAPCAWAELVLDTPPTLWRVAHDTAGQGRTRWPSDYGVAGGRCNASIVGNLVGGPWAAAGANGYGRSVATLSGSVPGYAFGSRLGPGMDAVDRGCMGHSLELAPSFHPVRWINPNSQAVYELTPLRRLSVHGRPCREFAGHVVTAGAPQPMRGTACRSGNGIWRMV